MGNKKNNFTTELFVCYTEPKLKQKAVLEAVRDSLVLQKEWEDIFRIRTIKKQNLKETSKKLAHLNKLYTNLKSYLPNTKHVFTYVNEELRFLEKEVGMLYEDKETISEEITDIKDKEISLKHTGKSNTIKNKDETKIKNTKVKADKEKVKDKENKANKNSVDKLDRIKHNLTLIEEKLKSLEDTD